MFELISLKLRELLSREEGQGATEYAVVIGFLVIGLAVGLGALGVSINNFMDRVAVELDTLFP